MRALRIFLSIFLFHWGQALVDLAHVLDPELDEEIAKEDVPGWTASLDHPDLPEEGV